MSGRVWYAVQCRLVRLPKFRALSDPAQLALIYLWALAGDTETEATWPSRDALADELRLHGRDPETIVELLERRWLDDLGDGRFAIHDWDQWQYAASKAIKSAWEANRVRTWRLTHKTPPAPPSQDRTGQDITTVRTPYDGVRTEGEPSVDPARLPPTDYDAAVVKAMARRLGTSEAVA